MMRRRGGPGVLSTMARTAVIAGTATATSNAVNARGAARAQAKQHAAQEQAAQRAAQEQAAQQLAGMQQQLAAQEAAIGTADIGSRIEQLKALAQLKDAGMLTDEEFALAKAKVLGS